jgi:lysophospholipase L1-like esterase
MITNTEAQNNYNTARKALNQIIRSDTATDEERRQATKQRDELILNYIGRQIDDVHARSAAYAAFIEAMAALIAKLGPDRPQEPGPSE